MVTAGIYLVVRSNFLYHLSPSTLDFILVIGLATSLIAAFIGLRQNDIKKVLAYSTVSQLGLMFIALGVEAYTSAMFHLMTHAFQSIVILRSWFCNSRHEWRTRYEIYGRLKI